MPAYFNNVVYYGAVGDTLKAFPITNAKLATSAAFHSANSFQYPGTTPAVSANGTTNELSGPSKTPRPPCCTRTTPRI